MKAQPADISIDSLLQEGLSNLQRIMSEITVDLMKPGIPERETIQSLKDCMDMLSKLKKEEQDLLENMSEEDMRKLVK